LRNVAALVKVPQGGAGVRQRGLTLEEAKSLLAAAEPTRLHACVVLSLLVGIRTEEAGAALGPRGDNGTASGDSGLRTAELLPLAFG